MFVHAVIEGRFVDRARELGLEVIEVDDLAAAGRSGEPSLGEHATAVTELTARTATLPVRYGTRLVDTEVADLLTERADEWREALARIRGRVEMAVRVPDPDHLQVERLGGAEPGGAAPGAAKPGGDESDRETGSDQGPGAAYLQHRLAEERHQERRRARGQTVGERLVAALVPDVAAAAKVKPAPAPDALVTVAFLVDASGLTAFETAVEELAAEYGRLGVAGPFPVFSFVPEPVT